MPEIVTRHPEVVLNLLKEAHIKCGAGNKQNILIDCPKDKFCSLPTGELCVYGTQDVSKLSQITIFDLLQGTNILIPLVGLLIMIFLLGVLTGSKISKK